MEVILNFQEEFLRHKRVVSTFAKLEEFYEELDLQFRK